MAKGGIFALYSLIRKYGAWLAIPAMLGGAAFLAGFGTYPGGFHQFRSRRLADPAAHWKGCSTKTQA